MKTISIPATRRSCTIGLIVAAALAGPSIFARAAATGAELLMFERAGCVYCDRWNAEIAPAYEAGKEAKIAPLRRVDLGKGQPKALKLSAPVRFTPTFVLVKDGVEIGRITGYLDNALFWGMLEKMVRPLRR